VPEGATPVVHRTIGALWVGVDGSPDENTEYDVADIVRTQIGVPLVYLTPSIFGQKIVIVAVRVILPSLAMPRSDKWLVKQIVHHPGRCPEERVVLCTFLLSSICYPCYFTQHPSGKVVVVVACLKQPSDSPQQWHTVSIQCCWVRRQII
jgi:hypothetical protein